MNTLDLYKRSRVMLDRVPCLHEAVRQHDVHQKNEYKERVARTMIVQALAEKISGDWCIRPLPDLKRDDGSCWQALRYYKSMDPPREIWRHTYEEAVIAAAEVLWPLESVVTESEGDDKPCAFPACDCTSAICPRDKSVRVTAEIGTERDSVPASEASKLDADRPAPADFLTLPEHTTEEAFIDVFNALRSLVELKQYKGERGKDEYYKTVRSERWLHAQGVIRKFMKVYERLV